MARYYFVFGLLVCGAVVAMVQAQDGTGGYAAPPPVVVEDSAPPARTAARPNRGSRYSTRSLSDSSNRSRRTAPPRELTPPRAAANTDAILPELPSVLKRRGAPPAQLPSESTLAPTDENAVTAADEMAASELAPPMARELQGREQEGRELQDRETPAAQVPGYENTDTLPGDAPAELSVEGAEEADAADEAYGSAAGTEPELYGNAAEAAEAGTELAPPSGLASEQAPATVPADASATLPVAAVQVSSRGPSIRIDVAGPGAMVVGKPAVFRVWMVNEGAEAARQVDVRLAIPARVELIANQTTSGSVARDEAGQVNWKVPQLAGGADEELILQLVPADPQPFELAVDWVAQPLAASARIDVQQPKLLVEINGPSEVMFGERQLYTITISNPGTGPADNVTLDVTTGGGAQSKPLGTIPAGGREQVRMELVAREAGSIDIQAVAAGDGALRSEAKHPIRVRRAELAVQLIGPRLKFAGSTGTYQVQVVNSGDAPATDVEVSLRRPASMTYVGGVEGAVETGGRIAWTVPHIDVGQELTFDVEMGYQQAGNVMCEAVAAAGELTAADQCDTQVEAIADLKLVVNDPENPKLVGDEVVYEVRITNQGTKASGPVNILGQFSDGIEPIRAEGARAEIVPGQVIFQQIPQVDAGQAVTLKIIAQAGKSGNHRFRAVLKAADPETELIAEDMTRFFGAEAATAPRITRKPTRK